MSAGRKTGGHVERAQGILLSLCLMGVGPGVKLNQRDVLEGEPSAWGQFPGSEESLPGDED